MADPRRRALRFVLLVGAMNSLVIASIALQLAAIPFLIVVARRLRP